ncbi:MAG: hypothetical protein A3A80_01925 [Candidatus Terrybacteria bacterium RIFCSPLOWO2_01_FULL_44_24]|uniref:Uncharacterized protein n=1 Tax=Candidatus Terrybacteria bacterium RIFCSPHIGHO2_01_FULL_43_35 TaxID=1802361 RepID=A0A1G2PE43_9BACT|nr:MAG: hypothetical protein A2828_01715 [Candidatus Terrybacteria bacterium RIFCSPHIGHO2_01_FULL_43_35]OHA50841.1 MAG: hypothetical protein A3A80_01925 [Candidatus Terrybacteria bacterium RIFCSPLOWO2_01_FULL_44_24]
MVRLLQQIVDYFKKVVIKNKLIIFALVLTSLFYLNRGFLIEHKFLFDFTDKQGTVHNDLQKALNLAASLVILAVILGAYLKVIFKNPRLWLKAFRVAVIVNFIIFVIIVVLILLAQYFEIIPKPSYV